MAGWLVDAEGEQIIYRVRGVDRTMPDAIFNCKVEVRPGGQMVAVIVDRRPVTTSPIPEGITFQEAEEQREARAAEFVKQEKAAAEMEKSGREKETAKAAPPAAA